MSFVCFDPKQPLIGGVVHVGFALEADIRVIVPNDLFGPGADSPVMEKSGGEALSPIWLTKQETARRVRQRISTVLDWAKAAGFRAVDDPVE